MGFFLFSLSSLAPQPPEERGEDNAAMRLCRRVAQKILNFSKQVSVSPVDQDF
jgi:hypothetical protein